MKYRELNSLPFEIADAESLTLFFVPGSPDATLKLFFVDIHGDHVDFEFKNVVAFRWSETFDVGIRNDCAYEVCDSDWLSQEMGSRKDAKYMHAKLCFNASGVLDLLIPKGSL